MSTVDEVDEPGGEQELTSGAAESNAVENHSQTAIVADSAELAPREIDEDPLPTDPPPLAGPEDPIEPADEVAADLDESAESLRVADFAWSTDVAVVPISLGWDAEPTVVDWFGTGSADLLVSHGGGSAGRRTTLLRAAGKLAGERFPTFEDGSHVPGLDGLRGVCVIPNASPTRFDLVALAPEGLIFLQNIGEAGRPAFGPRTSLGLGPDLGFGEGQVAQIVSVDWDGDGKFDLLVGFNAMEGYWPDAAVPPEQRIGLNQRGGHPGYDRRGLWRGTTPIGRLHWLQNVGTLGAPQFEPRPEIASDLESLELGMHPAPLAVAWGGGAGLELLAVDERGLAKIYRNFGGQRPPVLMEPRSLTCGGALLTIPEDRTRVVAADIDGDRRVELVYGTRDGAIFAVHSGPIRDSASTPAPLMQVPGALRLGGRAVLAAADLDSDGGIDLIYGDGPGRLHRLRDLGQGPEHRYARPEPIEAAGEPYQVDPGPDGRLLGPVAPKLGFAAPAVGDWLDHDRLDLVVGTAGGEVLIFANDGSRTQPRFAYPVPLKCSGAALITPPRVRPALSRWSGESTLDLLTLDLQGFLAVFPRVGPQEVGPPEPIVDRLGRLIRLDGGFGQGGRCSLWAGDFTGSGLDDILVGIPRDARYLVPPLLGRGLAVLDSLPTVILLRNLGNNVVVPHPVLLEDGTPLIIGSEGCSPNGVDATGTGRIDLLVGSDDGSVHYFDRGRVRF
ncbi:MAG: hypothetical protein SFX72_03930 [Isosphaeraceae bacterium]|nr:hypothetical protein [Isosphaeraceae bacterium]